MISAGNTSIKLAFDLYILHGINNSIIKEYHIIKKEIT